MRTLLLITILSVFWIDSFAQDEQIVSFKFLAKPDSIIEPRQHGYIYLTTDTTSKLYNWIVPNPNDKYLVNIFADYINHIKENYKQDIIINDIKDFPRKWNSVYVYKDKYYLYGPSDWMMNTGYYISDSVIYITKSDPNDLYLILNFKHINHNLTNFKIINYFGDYKTIQIQLIDSNYGLYVWTLKNNQDIVETKYLMQDSRFSKKLPMIVCDCGDEKCFMEFEFDTPNFDKLIKK